MGSRHDDGHWARYNDTQIGRTAPRELCATAMSLAGPGGGRVAIDLGCGAGVETRALLAAGWRVYAVDSEPGTPERLGGHPDLSVTVGGFEEIVGLPAADLIHAGYALPFQTRGSFDRLWPGLLSKLRPGGLLAVDLFGEHDSWAGDPAMTFLTAAEARSLVAGLAVERFTEEDGPGEAFTGPKHWHVFHVIARRVTASER